MARLILLADDSPTIQRRAQSILEAEGFEVETVSNGVAAIKKLPKMQPVLVLADVSMPGKDGYEVCDYVKTSADLHHVPVLLVASDLEPYDELRGTQVGADGIIKKPFAPHDLIAMVAKFAAPCGAPASALAETPVIPSPMAPPEVSPTGFGLEGAEGGHELDLAAPSAGMAFGEPPEIPATPPEPTPEPIPEAAPESVLVSSESISETVVEPLPQPAPVAPEPTPEHVPEAEPESALVSPESISETVIEFTPEPTLVAPEPTPEHVPEAAPESVLVSPESISETVIEPTPEPALIAPEPTPEPISEAAPESVLVSPESISETVVEPMPEPTLAPEPTPEPVPEAAPEAVLVSPESITGTAPEATSELAPVVSEAPVADQGQQPKPMAATSLDSFSLTEAAEGQVYIAPPEAEATPSPEAGVVQPGEATEPPTSAIKPEWVYVIVHKVVMKMAPPVLPADLVGELIRILAEEITAELNSESSQAR